MHNFLQYIRIRVVCAELEMLISKLAENGIDLLQLKNIDSLTLEFTLLKRQISSVKVILNRYGGSYRIIRQNSVQRVIMQLRRRQVLLCGTILLFLLLYSTSGRIFFIEVIGNQQISKESILAQAQMYGLTFGAKAVDVRSEEIKNAILGDFPQLQWLGITTEGSVATIHVSERSIPEKCAKGSAVGEGIYALRDGVISKSIIQRGTPLYQVGQRVKAGDLLVSGYTDCGIKIRAERPAAEIFAYTLRNLTAVTPQYTMMRGRETGNCICHKIRIGKKVINLCNHSGIHDTTCVKMYAEEYLTLPGGFQLPISWMTISYQQYDITSAEIAEDVYIWLPQYLRKYLKTQMIAGEIIKEDFVWNIGDQMYMLSGSYTCQEIIGQVKNEEIIEHHAEDN